MLEEVGKLIDKKEIPGNLDRAIELLQDLRSKHPDKDIIRGKLAHAYYYKGYQSPDGSKERENYFEQGVTHGKEAITLNPRALYGNFWYASNLGMLGICRGIMSSLRSVDPMKQAMELVLKSNERFFFAGPHRALGRLYHQAPGWPLSVGSKSKAADHLERSVALAPEFLHNHLFLAELYLDTGEKKKAKAQLDWILDAPVNAEHANEDGGYKAHARKLRGKFF